MYHLSSASIIIKHSEVYHYNAWDNFTTEDDNLHSVTFKWCNLLHCKFIRSILADSDWDSCKVVECTFQDISFENSDITSTYFENCNFNNVCFRGATVTDITFFNCTFTNCDFNHIGLNSSIFDKCNFISFKLRQSSTSLNYYRDCYFFDAKISGNFFFNILVNSHFEKSNISEELFGSNFGFSQANLTELSLEKENLKKLQQTYLDNKDIVGAAVVALNLEERNYDYAIWTSMQTVIEQLKTGILIRAEQLLFLKSVIEQLIEHNKISLYTILAIISILEKLNSFESNIALKKSEMIINQLRSELFDFYHKSIEQIHKDLSQICQNGEPISVKITYNEKPQIELCILLEQIMNAIGIESPIPVRERTAVGSFIEWIQGYDNILKCIQLLISILGLNIKLHKKAVEQPATEKIQNTIKCDSMANTGTTNSVVFQIPESVLEQLKATQTEQDVSKTINVFVLNGVTINNNFQGYNNFNVKSIEIL